MQKYKRDDSIQCEINMIIEAEYNNIGHIKYLLNEKNKLVERQKSNIIEAQQNIVQDE